MTKSLLVFACDEGWGEVLSDELARVFSAAHASQLGDSWVSIEVDRAKLPSAPTVAFATQCLPDASVIEVSSISNWVEAVGPRLIDALVDHSGPWRMHVFGMYRSGGSVGPRRAKLIENGIVDLLRKKQRRLMRELTPGTDAFVAGEAIVQVGLVGLSFGYFSACLPKSLHELRHIVSSFPRGVVNVPPDPHAPSRAFAKLLEAEIRGGRWIATGETCVDLGSSPGSWAYVALQRGANVVAVDRSPLRADLMKHPALKFVTGDAFRFEPSVPVDWLLCDVIAFPDRILNLLKRWLTERWCRQFCVTIKFRGTDEYSKLEPIKAWLAASGAEFLLRRLTSNKNEVTAFGGERHGAGDKGQGNAETNSR